MRGSKGIAIFPSRALSPHLRYVFDISDTGGRNVKLTWDLNGNTLKEYADYLAAEGQIEHTDTTDREALFSVIKDFTKKEIGVIIKEDFDERMSELLQLSGSGITEYVQDENAEQPKRQGLPDMEQLVEKSVLYTVGTRCGFDLYDEEQDFSQVVNVSNEEMVYRLGSLVCDVSCSVLRGINSNLKTMEQQKRLSAEGRIAYGRNDNQVHGSGRTALSEHSDAGRADDEVEETGQVRKDGDEISGGNGASEIQNAVPFREVSRQDAGSGRGSEQPVGEADGTVPSEAQAAESVIDNGDVEAERTGEDAGRGSSAQSGSNEVSLEDEELNRELNELDSFGKTEAGEYHQASFFDAEYGLASPKKETSDYAEQAMKKLAKEQEEAKAGKYNYINPKKELVVPPEFIKQVLLRGSGFANGRTRICEIFQTEIDAGTRAQRIKKEYGLGGAGWPIEGYGLHGYDSFHAQGLRFQWRDEEGEHEGYVSWKNIEKEIGVLIMTGEYQPETPRFEEFFMEGSREDDEVIDGEYREAEETEETEEFDDYAIPDEPESYHSSLTDIEKLERAYNEGRPLTDEEAAIEDRMATMAEYGPEMEMEAEYHEDYDEPEAEIVEEHDRSELQFITPIDYAKRIEEMDTDLRTALEILVTECSCYTPYKPFLMDIVASEYLFMPNKLDFLSDVVLNGKEERKAYANNEYGLIEYTLKPFEFEVSYKDRNDERVRETVGYRELYEVLTYMVKTPYYCGADHREQYEKMMRGETESRNPIYQLFIDKQEEIKANREATKERAIANGWDVVEGGKEDKKINFHYNLVEVPKGGAKTRFKWNIDAIETLKKIEAEGRLATGEEQKILSNYVGWGGLSQAFDERNATWEKEYATLKSILSEEE